MTTCKTEFKENSATLKMQIDNFELLETAVSSSKFKFEQEDAITEWKFEVFPKHRADGIEYVSTFLVATNLIPAQKSFRVKWCCAIYNKFGLEQNINVMEHVYSKTGGFGFSKFLNREKLLNKVNGLIRENSIFLKFELKVMEERKFMIPEKQFSYSPQIERFFAYKLFTDVTLLCDNREIKAHKLVLADQSATFNEIFQNDSKNIFVIKEFAYDTMLELIKFLYTDRVESLKKNAKKLLFVAERYSVDRLRRLCERSLFENLTIENSIETLLIADKHMLAELKEESLKFIKMHLSAIVKNLDWDNFVKTEAKLLNILFKCWVHHVGIGLIKMEMSEVKCGVEFKENELNDDFESLFEKQLFTDVTFEIRGRTLKAHKSILSGRSEAFSEIFESESTNCISINDIDYETFKELIRFIYCGRVNNMKLVAWELLPAAERYRLEKLKMSCEIYLRDNLTVENAVDTWLVANFNNCTELKKRTIAFLKTNILQLIELVKWDKFTEKHPEMVNEILLKWLAECGL